jgi:hypothetical protein
MDLWCGDGPAAGGIPLRIEEEGDGSHLPPLDLADDASVPLTGLIGRLVCVRPQQPRAAGSGAVRAPPAVRA